MARSMNMTIIRAAILALFLFSFAETISSQQVRVVGDRLGWTIPPAGPAPYDAWAATHIFVVGDILEFNFTNGDQDVARVTREAFLTCNTRNPLEVKKTNPANFTLNSTGDWYFTSTLDRHCELGQKLAVHVLASRPSPRSQPKPTRGPRNFTVGGPLGWIVPPGGEIVYISWVRTKTFRVGDALEFWFINGTQDVAEVKKEDYEKCKTNNSIAVYSSSPVRIVLKTTGEHFYTSTYLDHCALGQKLAINVTSNTSSSSSSSESAFSPEEAMPPSTPGSSASRVLSAYMPPFLAFIAMAFFY